MRVGRAAFPWAIIGLLLAGAPPLAGQVTWQDLVFTGGISGESYSGNLPAVTVTNVDSTEHASAAVGELGVRGGLILLSHIGRTLTLQLDGGLRQFSAGGFKIRDYAPREWVGRADLTYLHDLAGIGQFSVTGGISGRGVDDRPPMPLFIQPGYGKAEARLRFQFLPARNVYFDAQLTGHLADYTSTGLTPQLDLLDQEALGAELGATWGSQWTLRLHTGFRAASYENQGTFDPEDPYRRDKALNLGATWTLRSSILAQVGVEGTFNRSNSSRPEYDALSVRTMLSVPLPQDLSLNLVALLTAKNYRVKSEFVQLVPGEEADNASVVYMELSRPVFPNLDGAFRFGWNRAETDIGDSYFERFGGSFLLRFRPLG